MAVAEILRPLSPQDDARAETVAHIIRQMKRPENGPVLLDEWAEYAGMSKYELTAAFRRLTGIPPKTFHNVEKLEIAKRLLVFEDMRVTDVCFEIGFESVGSFVSKFTKFVGLSPGSYAREMTAASFIKAYLAAILSTAGAMRDRQSQRRLTFHQPADQTRQNLIAAVFEKPFPSGYPAAWRFVPATRAPSPAVSRVAGHCLVASRPFFPKKTDLINLAPALIGRAHITRSSQKTEITMAPPTIFDPPITLAVPAMLSRPGAAA